VQTVICMKWGARYGADFVNRLSAAIERNTQRPTQLVCLTDDPSGIDDRVRCEPIPHINLPDEMIFTPWRERERILSTYRIEQIYISREIEDMVFWPASWCASFKHSLLPTWPLNFFKTPKLPADTKIVAFTGKPDQDEALIGKWPVKSAWKKIYKHVRPTHWIADHW